MPALELDFADYAAWQHEWLESGGFKKGLQSWKERLTGIPDLLELPWDLTRPMVQSYTGGRVRLQLERGLVIKLRELGRQHQVTLFMVMNTAYALLLGRYSRQDDVVIGIPMANRSNKDLENMVGFFVNTLPLRIDISGNPNLPELLHQVRNVALDAFTHQEVPLEKLIEELHIQRDTRFTPVFQVLFAIQNMSSPDLHLGECVIVCDNVNTGNAKFDLSLFVKIPGRRLAPGI